MAYETAFAEPVTGCSPEHLSRLIVSSFRFSQGSPSLQTQIVQYVTHDFEFSEPVLDTASALAEAQAVEVLARGHNDIILQRRRRSDKQLAIDEFNVLRGTLSQLVDPDNRTPREDLLPKIHSAVLHRDKKYAEKGRRSVGTPDGRYFSYFVRHAILGVATGSAEYKELFTALGDKVLRRSTAAEASAVEDLTAAVVAHTRQQPEDTPAIETWWADHATGPLALSGRA